MTPRQKKHLQRLIDMAVERQPRMTELRERLLSAGGEEVCFPFSEEDLPILLERGEASRPESLQLREGARSQCHANSVAEWLADEELSIVTGYALSEDGIWHQHTWCVDGKTVVETTTVRTDYFGVILTHEEAEVFAHENGH